MRFLMTERYLRTSLRVIVSNVGRKGTKNGTSQNFKTAVRIGRGRVVDTTIGAEVEEVRTAETTVTISHKH